VRNETMKLYFLLIVDQDTVDPDLTTRKSK
jgi:hypothetical protein